MNRPTELEVDVFHGQISPYVAHVYARVESIPGGGDWTLSGKLRGPHCDYAHTLPVTVPLADLGDGKTLLARASLIDPCFWTCELPAIYEATLELRQRSQVMATWHRIFGLRNLGARGRSFYWEGQRWVLRGIHCEAVADSACSEWREQSAAMIVPCPDDSLCEEASQKGVLLVARVNAAPDLIPEHLRRLAQWPAVGMVVLDGVDEQSTVWRHLAPNLLLACRGDLAVASLPPWAHCMLVESELVAAEAPAFERFNVPLVAVRKIMEKRSLVDARIACDDLQRDLAVMGDFAGYIV